MTNIYLKVTKSGHVYDQSFGRNKKLFLDRKYILKGGGNMEIGHAPNGVIILHRRDKSNKLIYTQVLDLGKHYIVSERGCEILLKRSRYVSTAYRYCKENISLTNEVAITKGLGTPYRIELVVEQGVIDYQLKIVVDEELFDHQSLSKMMTDIDNVNNIDFNRFIRHYNALETTFTVDVNFFNIVDSLGMKRKSIKLA